MATATLPETHEGMQALAHSAGRDAANRHMRAAGRTTWDASDMEAGAAEARRIYPEQLERDMLAAGRTDDRFREAPPTPAAAPATAAATPAAPPSLDTADRLTATESTLLDALLDVLAHVALETQQRPASARRHLTATPLGRIACSRALAAIARVAPRATGLQRDSSETIAGILSGADAVDRHMRAIGTVERIEHPAPHDPAPEFRQARYSRGNVAVHCPSNGTELKTRAARLCEHLNARYSNREHAYIMSPRKAERLRHFYDTGHDAYTMSGDLIIHGERP